MSDNTDSGYGAKCEGLRGPEAAAAFAEWRGHFPIAVTTIEPDGRGGTPTFYLDRPEEVAAFVSEWSGKRNIYYTHARLRERSGEKPKKAHLEGTEFLHADLDPPKKKMSPEEIDQWIDDELDRIRTQTDVPQPSALVVSGNGLMALWRLDKFFEFGDPTNAAKRAERIELIEAHTRGIRVKLNADKGTHNIDRVLRLAGGDNLADSRKRKIGRVRRETRVVYLSDTTHSLDAFPQVWEDDNTDTVDGDDSGAEQVSLERVEPIRLNELSELDQYDLPPWVAGTIEHGDHPTEPGRWDGDRSRAVFAVTGALLRAGVPTALIVGILIDERWRISDHQRDHEMDTVRYAREQVENALKKGAQRADWPMRDLGKAIEWVNARYFAAREGTDYTFFREDRDRVQPLKSRGFDFELADKQVVLLDKNKNESRHPIGKLWKSDPRRRVYPRGLILEASGEIEPGAYNLWRGFGVEPAHGDWSLMKAHIRDVLARGNEEHADYILNWTAWSFQNPATPPRVALVFRGGEGVGKGIFASNLVSAFGHHGLHVWSMQQVSGRFNSHLRHCCFLYADEVDAQDGNGSGALRGLITERTIPCEGKGVDLVQVDNHIHLVMASNEEWVVPAGKDARRYAVFDVSGEHQGDKAYFAKLAAQMKNGGLAAMIYDMLAMDLTDFHPEGDRPETDALGEQRAASLTGFERLMFDLLATGELPKLKSTNERGGGNVFVSTFELTEYGKRWTKRDDVTMNKVAGLLEKLGAEYTDTDRPRGWVLPPLAKMREIWDDKIFRVPWKPCDKWGFPVWRPRDDFDDDGPY